MRKTKAAFGRGEMKRKRQGERLEKREVKKARPPGRRLGSVKKSKKRHLIKQTPSSPGAKQARTEAGRGKGGKSWSFLFFVLARGKEGRKEIM